MNHYLVFIYDDVDPMLVGPFPSKEMRDDKAIDMREELGKQHGIYSLDIDGPGKPTIDTYSGGFFMGAEED